MGEGEGEGGQGAKARGSFTRPPVHERIHGTAHAPDQHFCRSTLRRGLERGCT